MGGEEGWVRGGEGDTWKRFFWRHGRNAIIIFLLVKTVMGMQNVLYPKPSIPTLPTTGKLETLYNQVRREVKSWICLIVVSGVGHVLSVGPSVSVLPSPTARVVFANQDCVCRAHSS